MIYDFAIIGGGIAGISAAARISPLGKTILLEGESVLAYHASGRSAALFEENYGAPTVVDLNKAGKSYLETANGGVLSDRGILMVAFSGQEQEFTKEIKTFKMDTISLSEAAKIVPILDTKKLIGSALNQAAKDIDTDLLLQNFAKVARRNDGEIRTNARVTKIEKNTVGWLIHCGLETITARILINAGGAWADQIAVLAGVTPLGLQPYRRSVARIPAPNGLDVSKWPMLFGVGESWYAKSDAGHLIVSPAEEEPLAPCDAWADDMVLAEGIARYSEAVTTEVTRVVANWAGLRTFAPDRTLVIGFDPVVPNFFWLAGQGGYGFQTAPGASALVSQIIGGTQPDLSSTSVAALSPNRFA